MSRITVARFIFRTVFVNEVIFTVSGFYFSVPFSEFVKKLPVTSFIPQNLVGNHFGQVVLQPAGGLTHRTGLCAGRDRRCQETAGGSPFGSTISPEQSDGSSIPSGRGDGNVPGQETVGGENGASRAMRTGQKKVCWAASAGTRWSRAPSRKHNTRG